MIPASPRLMSDEIRTIYSMIHMIYHRNKNQHGIAKWWKSLRMLKGSIYSLLMAIETDSGNAVAVYEDYIQRRLVPKCYLAFSAVVADAQFSALGTVLVAIVARIANVIGIQEKTARSSTVAGDKGANSLSETIWDQIPDMGEPVRRANDSPAHSFEQASDNLTDTRSEFGSRRSTSNDQASRVKSARDTPRGPSTDKNRRRPNAIDDLFSTIL